MKKALTLTLAYFFVAVGAGDAQIQKKKAEVPRYIKNLTAKDAKERIAACQGIAAVGQVKASFTKEAVEPLCEVVQKDSDAKVRAEAAVALGLISPPAAKAAPILIAALKDDKDDGVQIAAINALGYLGTGAKDAMPLLKEINDKYRAEQNKARQERQKFIKEKDDKNAQLAQRKEQAAGRWTQATGDAMRSINQQQ